MEILIGEGLVPVQDFRQLLIAFEAEKVKNTAMASKIAELQDAVGDLTCDEKTKADLTDRNNRRQSGYDIVKWGVIASIAGLLGISISR